MQKEPSARACDIANPFPPDLWGYVYGFSYWLDWYGHKLLPLVLPIKCMANLFLPDFWDYVHRFRHQPEGSIALFAYYDPLKKLCSWQQYHSLRLCYCRNRTLSGRCKCMRTLCKYNAAELRDIQECYKYYV